MKTSLRTRQLAVLGLVLGAVCFAWSTWPGRSPRPARLIESARPELAENSPAAGVRQTTLPPAVFPADIATSSHPVERAVAQGTVLDEQSKARPDGTILRERLVRSSIMPRPMWVQEIWAYDSPSALWKCQRREMFLADQLILRVPPQTSRAALAAFLSQHRLQLDTKISTDLCTVRLPEAGIAAMHEALTALAARPDLVAHAEADGVGFGGGIPNDPSFGSQWALDNTGQSGGTADADIDAPEFWDILENTPGGVVAVLDSGLNFTHPDLQGITWTNPAEIPGDGQDNDGDGFVDDVRGWDFTNNDNDPTDDHGHGSNVSGIIAANRNNGVGVAGLLSGVKIMVCKILNASNAGTTSALIAATTYARLRGAPIMNLSLQNYPYSATLNTEFNACQAAGILLAICAGNQGVSNDLTPNFPSCYPQANIIAVGNHDRTDVRWAGSLNPSNFGITNVDLFAPGREILSPILGTGYSYYTGTSQATTFVTAVAAAIKYMNPEWSAAEIKSNILNSVVTNRNYSGICVTGGRLNAVTSLAAAISQRPAADRDGDGFGNFYEYLAGTRVDTATSKPLLTNWSAGGSLHLSSPQVVRPEAHLLLERSTNLVDWTSTGITDFSTANQLHGAIPITSDPMGFLRLSAALNP